MKSYLEPIDIKINKSKNLLNEIKKSIYEWISLNEIHLKHFYSDDKLAFQLIVESFIPPPLDEWSLNIGIIINLLRSALDNLAFALSRLKTDPPIKPKQIYFPICDTLKKFNEAKKYMSQMDKSASQLIEALQPFQRDGSPENGTIDSDLLLLLQKLNNYDKHQIPCTAEITLDNFNCNFSTNVENIDITEKGNTIINNVPLKNGAIILELHSKSPLEVHGNFNYKYTISVIVDNKPYEAIDILERLGYYTELVIAQFRRFFN